MKIFKKILDFYIDSSIHVALTVYALIRITFIKLDLIYDEPVAYFGFYGTIVGYNFIKFDELTRIKKIELTTKLKLIIGVSFLSFLATVFYFFNLNFQTKLYAAFALIITVSYTLPFFPKFKNIRNWSGVKIYLVAIAWMIVTVILPFINSEIEFSRDIIVLSIQRFLLIFVLMLIFEIVDLKSDDSNLKTIPQTLGISKTKYLGYLLLVLFFVVGLYAIDYLENFTNNYFVVLLSLLFLYNSNEQKSKYYASFWVESVPIFWWLMFLFF